MPRKPMIHELKTDPEPFQDVWELKKRSEQRFNDRDFQVGDTVKLQEYDRISEIYSGREVRATISYVTDYPSALKDGWVMFCLRNAEGTGG